MELVLVDKSNYKKAIEIQNNIFPNENGALNILASLGRDAFMKITGLDYEDDHVRYYLAKMNEDYIGITGIYYYDLDSAWIGWFGILEKYRNKGMGRDLLKKTINLAVNMNFKFLRLYTDFIENCKAINLYEEEGFIGEKYTYEKLTYDCRIYSKSLTNEDIVLWNNKNLRLTYQSELDHMNEERINDIIQLYDNKINKY